MTDDTQATLAGDTLDARVHDGEQTCQHTDHTIEGQSRFAYGDSWIADGSCERTADVSVAVDGRRVLACRFHARDAWLASAGVE
jgi:hypothetical protein